MREDPKSTSTNRENREWIRNLSSAPSSEPPLQRQIVKTLLYSDVIRHPLSFRELYRFLPHCSMSARDIVAETTCVDYRNAVDVVQEDTSSE